ncbi:hypothetical protein ABPG74_009219 [Tetrahymena malaccensis]
MGGCSSCMRKPVLVYQSILDECYNILFQVNSQNTKLVQKKRYNKNYMESGQNQENEDFISQFEELTSESLKVQAAASYKEFMTYDIPKLEGQVKLQAKNLSDHIQDTHIRLIDTVKYLKAQLKNFQTDYGVQWVTLMILEVLVQNLKNYTQKHISLKHGQVEDSNLVSKLDVLTENNEANNSTKEERNQNANGNQNQNNVQDQITFFSDNFIRFEIDFIDIALFILNEKYNPFYFQSQNQFMKILLKFSQLHKDPYTSDKIYGLVDQLETDLFNLTKEIIPSSNEDQLPQWEAIDKQKVQTLSNLQITYQATLSKLKTLQSVFGTKQQLNFFFFSLQTIIDFNRILRNYSSKMKSDNNNNAVPQSPLIGGTDQILQPMKSSDKPVHLIIAEVTSNCLGILAVFSRRGFILKNYNSVLSNLFQFFDQVKWDTLLLIENIINETISVSRMESVQLNYKVFLMEQLIEYLSLSKQLSGLPSLYFNNNFKQVNVFGNQAHAQSQNEISLGLAADNNPAQSQKNSKIQQNSAQKEQNKEKEDNIPQGLLKLENFSDPKVKIRAFKIFNMLTSQKDKEIPLLMHSTNKIVKCYLDNLKDYNELYEVKRAIQQSFVHYTLQLAPDSSALLSLLTALSNEICEYMSSSNFSKGMQQGSHTPLQSPNTNGINNQMYMIKSPSEHSNSINLINQYYGNDQTKYIIEGLNLMLLALDCSSYFTSSPIITDEVIINLIFICNQKQVSLMVYEVTCKLILLKMKPITESVSNNNLQSLNHQVTAPAYNMRSQAENTTYSASNGNNISNQFNSISQMFQQISQNSLLHIFHQTIKCVFNLNMQQDLNSINTAVVIFQYTFLIIQEITKRNNVFQIRAVVAYLMKLVKETISYQNQRDCISINGAGGNSTLDANLFNSTNNQFVLQQIQKNGVGIGQQPIQKHPACFNITQLAICQILKVLEIQIINNTTNSFAEIEHIITNITSKEYTHISKIYQEIFTIHIEVSNLNKKLNYQVENYSKTLSQQKSFSLKSNSPSAQYQSQDDIVQTLQEHKIKLQKLCQQLQEAPYIHNEIFNNTQIQDNIQKAMKTLGLNPEQDFDQLTAQFARNFTSAVGDIDFNNYNLEDEISLNNTAQKNQRKSLNYNYLRLNTNESLGDLERQDDQFGNIMNMIQPQNPNILNYLNDRNRDNKEKFNSNNNDYQQQDLNQLQNKNNQQSQFLDAVDIQLKV